MSAETIASLHLLLENIEPAIWRRVEVPVTASLKMLHDIVQAAMGWENSYLWHFEAGDRCYGVPDPMWPESGMGAAKNVKLAALIDRGMSELFYTYDMGDDWRHTITIETVGPGEHDVKYPRFVEGQRRCPPKDVGGLPGYEMFLDAMADPAHDEHDWLREWYGGPYNADDIDERFTCRAVAAIPVRSPTRRASPDNKAVYRPRLRSGDGRSQEEERRKRSSCSISRIARSRTAAARSIRKAIKCSRRQRRWGGARRACLSAMANGSVALACGS